VQDYTGGRRQHTRLVEDEYSAKYRRLKEAEEHCGLSKNFPEAARVVALYQGLETTQIALDAAVRQAHKGGERVEDVAAETETPQEGDDRNDIVVLELQFHFP